MAAVELVTHEARLDELAQAWDELAVDLGRPFCAPAWGLAWWRHARPPEAQLRVVALTEDGQLVGIAPFYSSHGPAGSALYRLLGSAVSARVEPLARPGLEPELARAVAGELAATDPVPGIVRLEGIPETSASWPESIANAWPGHRPTLVVEQRTPAPVLTIAGRSFDEYLASRTSHFRKRILGARRKLEAAGARISLARDPAELERGLRAFARFHRARFEQAGGSGVLTPGVEGMLDEVAAGPVGRLQVWLVDSEAGPVASELVLSAGHERSSWLGGFDVAWAKYQPSIQALVAAIEQAHGEGAARVDLGPGAQAFKYRFADGEEHLRTVALVPRGRGYLRRRAALLVPKARRAVSERLSDRQRAALRRLVRRG